MPEFTPERIDMILRVNDRLADKLIAAYDKIDELLAEAPEIRCPACDAVIRSRLPDQVDAARLQRLEERLESLERGAHALNRAVGSDP